MQQELGAQKNIKLGKRLSSIFLFRVKTGLAIIQFVGLPDEGK